MRRLIALAALAAALAAAPAGAKSPVSEDTVHDVASQLRCVVCQSLSVADSPSETAHQMKDIIRERLTAGESPEQVRAYFVEKYGTWILLSPPRQGFNLLVWVVPFVGLGLGLVLVLIVVRRWSRRPCVPGPRDCAPSRTGCSRSKSPSRTRPSPACRGGSLRPL